MSDEMPGWIAGYPPWTANAFLAACDQTDRETGVRLLHAKRAIDDGKPADLKKLLRSGLDPNSQLPFEDGSLLSYAFFKHPNAKICEVLLDAGAETAGVEPPAAVYRPGFESILERLSKAGVALADHHGEESQLVLTATGGSAETRKIMQRMLASGMNVNGTGKVCPDNKRYVYQCTALMTAAWRGNVATVEMLLKAGANPAMSDSEGRTALDWAQSRKGKKQDAVIKLLTAAGAASGNGAELGFFAIPDFSKAAKAPEYKKCLAEIRKLVGGKALKVELEDDDVGGASALMVDEELGRTFVDEHREEFLSRGAFIFLSRDVTERNGSCIVVLPTDDCYDAIAAIQTCGANSGVTTADLIRWLKNLALKQPFVLQEIAPDLIRGRFSSAIKRPKQLLKEVFKLCPDLDMGEKLTAAKAKQWAAKKSLYLWWN